MNYQEINRGATATPPTSRLTAGSARDRSTPLFNTRPLNIWLLGLLIRRHEGGRSYSGDSRHGFHVMVNGPQIRVCHGADVKPRHWRTGHETLPVLEPLVFRHLADREPEIGGISCSPRASEPERIALQPVSLCCLTACFGVSGGVAVIATCNFHDVPATFDLLCVCRSRSASVLVRALPDNPAPSPARH